MDVSTDNYSLLLITLNGLNIWLIIHDFFGSFNKNPEVLLIELISILEEIQQIFYPV